MVVNVYPETDSRIKPTPNIRIHISPVDDYMKESLEALMIFEKDAMQTYLAKIDQSEELAIHNNIRRMSEK